MLSLTFVFNYSVLSCQGAWLHPLFSSVEVVSCPELSQNKYLGFRLGGNVLCVGSSHPLWSCIRTYITCSNALIYLWSRILILGQLMEMMSTLMYTVNFVSAVLFSTVVLLEWRLMNGMLNIYHLRHDSRRLDCTIIHSGDKFMRKNMLYAEDKMRLNIINTHIGLK